MDRKKQVANTRIGVYQLGGSIGKGGFGCVYKALDQQSGHFVAVKQVSLGGLHSGDIGSIEVEINLLSKLKHKNIVKYIDSIRTDTHLNIVLEFIEGGSIAAILKKFGAFPETLCAIYTLQILKGLKFLHSQGVIHRDIKGANVLTTKTGTIKLADFGVATKLSEIDSSKRRVVGTPYWMAPETVEMSPPTPASDIWSVGSTVIEMVTEKPPYAELPQMSALYRIVSDVHPPLPEGFSEDLEKFLLKCYEKSPIQRPGAAMLLEDPWIQGNKRHLEFKMLPKIEPGREDESDSGEELEALTTLVQESLATQLRPKEAAQDAEPKEEKTETLNPKPSLVRVEDEVPKRSPEGSALGSPEPEEGQREEEKLTGGYHFAFLDYYYRRLSPKEAPETSAEVPSPEAEELKLTIARPSLAKAVLDDSTLDREAHKDREKQRVAAEVKSLLARIRPFEEPAVLVNVCSRLTELLQQGRSNRENKESIQQLVMQHGAVPIVEMLQVTDAKLQNSVLKVVNQIVADGNQDFQELFSMVGLIPGVIKFARTEYHRSLRVEVGKFISRVSSSASGLLVACGGLEAIVDLISSEYYHNRDLVWAALEDVNTVLNMQGSHQRDLCRILAKLGICEHLVVLIDTLASDIMERAAQHLQLVVSLLAFFAKTGDAVVKAYMAKATVLEGLIASLEFLSSEQSVQICKIFKHLAQEPSVLNMMENAGVVPVLVHHMAVPAVDRQDDQDACSQCLLALSNLCKLSRPRQEQAALAGIIPKLQAIVERQHPLREHAFVTLCDMPLSSLATRKLLWSQQGAPFLVRSLALAETQVPALEALVGWFGVKEHKANWCQRLESLLLKGPDFLMRLFSLFKCQDNSIFLKVLDPLLKLVHFSAETNAALANSDEFVGELLRRLESEGSMEDSKVHSLNLRNSNSGELEEVALDSGPVRRLVSAQAAEKDDDSSVRARQALLRLLMQLCQPLTQEQLASLVQRFHLKLQLQKVLAEERRRQRVILSAIASQLLKMFDA